MAYPRHFRAYGIHNCFLMIVSFAVVMTTSMVWVTFLEKQETISVVVDDEIHSSFDDNTSMKADADVKCSHQHKLPRPNCSQKLLIYQCTSDSDCFGLGDRERGIISSFLLALLTSRTFVINYTKPCQLSSYFEPNIYNWTECLDSVQEPLDDVFLVKAMGTNSNLPDLSTLEKGDIWNERNVVINTNAILDRPDSPLRKHPSVNETIPWLRLGSREYTSHLVFNALFKLTPSLEDEINKFIRETTDGGKKRLVAFHVRRAFITEQDLSKIFDAMKLYSNESEYTIFLATESKELRDLAKEMIPECVTLNVSGIELHVDNPQATCQTFKYAIFEQFVLSRADIMYKTSSVFSVFSYIIRGEDAVVYRFDGKGDNYQPHLLQFTFPNKTCPVLI